MNIGFLSESLPYLPARDGFRTYGGNVICRLHKRHRIDLVSLTREDDESHLDWARQYCHSIRTIPVRTAALPMRGASLLSSNLLGKPLHYRRGIAAVLNAGIRERGWDVHVVGDAHAHTDAPGTLGSFLRQRRRWFAGFLQTQYWNRDMTGNPRYGSLGMLMLPVKAIDTMQPIYGLTAFALLLGFLFGGHGAIVVSIFSVIGLKTAIDLAFYLWCIHLYRRWTGERTRASLWMAVLAAIAEPFTFQLVRHVGALLGWLHFLRGGRSWGAQRRAGLVAHDES